jgi:uncharacterized protein YjbI with pentapeptide repeats
MHRRHRCSGRLPLLAVIALALAGLLAPSALAQSEESTSPAVAGTGAKQCTVERSANCRGIRHHRVDLSGRDLRGIHFHRADLRHADFRGSDLRGARFHGALLHGADFSDADLRGARFDGTGKGAGKTVRGCPPSCSGATLYSTNYSNANLAGANFSNANVRSANFTEANLTGANLYAIRAISANFTSANLNSVNATYGDFLSANLTLASMLGANFNGARLMSANLSWATVDSSTTKFPYTDFTAANMMLMNGWWSGMAPGAVYQSTLCPNGTMASAPATC